MIVTSRVSMYCALCSALATLLLGFATTTWAEPTPFADATCAITLSQLPSSGRESVYMVNYAAGVLYDEVTLAEENKSKWFYPQATLGASERQRSFNVNGTDAKLEDKNIALGRWEEIALNLGQLKSGRVTFAHTVEGRDEVAEFLKKMKVNIDKLNSRVEPRLAGQKFWDTQRKFFIPLRSFLPLGALLGVGGGATLITGLDMTEPNNFFGAVIMWMSTFGAKDTAKVLPWWAAIVSKRAQRYVDERSSYRTFNFSEGLEQMAVSVGRGTPGWQSVHLVAAVRDALAQEILQSRDLQSDDPDDPVDPDFDPLALMAELTINSNISNRQMRMPDMRWATVDLFMSTSPQGVPTLVIAGGLQKDFSITPRKRQKPKREALVEREEFGLVPQPIPVRK